MAETKKPKEELVHKYSKKGQGELREAVIVEGKPVFLGYKVDKEKGKDYTVTPPIIEEPTRKLIPPHLEEYPYEPYVFSDVKEPDYYLKRVKGESIPSFYQEIKSYVKLFNDVDEKTLNLLSAIILASYFQDKFSTVVYLIIVGDNGTGKSAIGDTFAALGYRTVVMTNPTKAIWYRVLGYIEYGQVTIVADESEGIEDSPEIMSILKDGYQTKHRVPRMDNDNKTTEWYFPFCIKMIICESSPTEYKAKGLLDRSFKIKTYKGYPQHDIKEVRNPQGNKIRQKLLDEIENLRKRLLLFKLYHTDPLPEIDVGLDGRDKELCKPFIQLFYGTESQSEIEETLQYFLNIKNERKNQGLEAMMYPIVVNAISEIGNEIPSRKLWEVVIDNLDGQLDEKSPNVFYSTDFGKLYINTVTKIATDKFGGEKKHGRKNNSILTFNTENLVKMGKIYGKTDGIQTKLVEIDCDACDAGDAPWRGAKPFYMVNDDEKHKKIDNLSTDLHENITNLDKNVIQKEGPTPESASRASSASPYRFNCYACEKANHGTPVYQTNSLTDYQKHWLSSGHKGPCYPGLADLQKYGWVPQDKPWEI